MRLKDLEESFTGSERLGQKTGLDVLNDTLDVFIALLKIVVDNEAVKDRVILELHLLGGGLQANLDLLLSFSAADTEALFELFHARRGDEDEVSGELDAAHRLAALDIEIEQSEFSRVNNGVGSGVRRSIETAVNLGSFNKLLLSLELLELLHSHKVVSDTIDLANARSAGGVGDGVAELGREVRLKSINDYNRERRQMMAKQE